jgi:uncharacterized protein YdhG (YjbR/CyaY superfamily)
VSAYLSALDPAQAKVLKRVLGVVRKSVPNATPVISYGIPAFKRDRVFIYCAAFKRHIGIFPPVHDATLRAALKPYANAKGNLRFPLDEPISMTLVARVAKALAKQYAQVTTARPRRGRRTRGDGPLAIDFEVVRSLGAALPDVKDASGSRGTALKLDGQLLACEAIHKSAEPNSLMVRISPKRREALLAQDTQSFYLTDHYAPYPAILVRLRRIKRAPLKELLAEAWEFVKAEAR